MLPCSFDTIRADTPDPALSRRNRGLPAKNSRPFFVTGKVSSRSPLCLSPATRGRKEAPDGRRALPGPASPVLASRVHCLSHALASRVH